MQPAFAEQGRLGGLFLRLHFIADSGFLGVAQEGDGQAILLRLADLRGAQPGGGRGVLILVRQLNALNRRIVGVDSRQDAVLQELF